MFPIQPMGRSPCGRCVGAHSRQVIHSLLEESGRAQGAAPALQVSLVKWAVSVQSPVPCMPPPTCPCHNPHTRLGRLHLEVDVDKKADAFARHNGGVDRVEGLIPQALLTGFRGIICVTLEVAWSPNHHQERPPKRAWLSVLHMGERDSKPKEQGPWAVLLGAVLVSGEGGL